MASWLQKLTRRLTPGLMPDSVKSQLESENLLLLAERVRVTVIFRNFRAPGKRYSHKRSGAIGSFGLSSKRVVGFAFSKWVIHLTYDALEFQDVTFRAEGNKYLAASFDAALFNPAHSGQMEIRFYLPDVSTAAETLSRYS